MVETKCTEKWCYYDKNPSKGVWTPIIVAIILFFILALIGLFAVCYGKF